MCVTFTQWLREPSHLAHDPDTDNEFKQATSGLLGATRHVYGHQNAAHKTGICLKRRYCTPLFSSFVKRCTRVDVSLYIYAAAALSRETKVMATVLTIHAATNIATPYGVLHPFSVYWLLDVVAYGDESLSCAHVFEWCKRFSGGKVSEKDEPAGYPGSAIRDKNIAKIRDMSGFPLTSFVRQLINAITLKASGKN
ncbi:hypothetical protein TNCV_4047781 [Trichonephila clavipes]|nr:hypothetical protein TNCV_4047781 [Trichonephila clavipes]